MPPSQVVPLPGAGQSDEVCKGWGTFSGLEYQIEHSRESARMTNGKNRHFITNLWIEPDGEGAVARYRFLNINAGSNPTEPIIVMTVRQMDKLVRTKRGWRIKDRTSIFDQVLPPMTDDDLAFSIRQHRAEAGSQGQGDQRGIGACLSRVYHGCPCRYNRRHAGRSDGPPGQGDPGGRLCGE